MLGTSGGNDIGSRQKPEASDNKHFAIKIVQLPGCADGKAWKQSSCIMRGCGLDTVKYLLASADSFQTTLMRTAPHCEFVLMQTCRIMYLGAQLVVQQ